LDFASRYRTIPATASALRRGALSVHRIEASILAGARERAAPKAPGRNDKVLDNRCLKRLNKRRQVVAILPRLDLRTTLQKACRLRIPAGFKTAFPAWRLLAPVLSQGRKVAQRKSGHVTLLDVARACGLSVSTVSIVLSEAPLSQNVAVTTRERIRVMAQQLGYHPDAFARSLRRRHSQTIGVLAYDLADPFCIPIVRGVEQGLQPASYLPLLMDAETRRTLFDGYLQMILERRAEGVIVIASWVFEETDLLADIKKNHVPVVMVSRDLTERGFTSVLVDNEAGGALAMRHLLDLGHRQIAVIRGPEEMFDSAPRWAGVERAATEAGLCLDPKLVCQLPSLRDSVSSFEGGLGCARQLLDAGSPFTAVLAFDDLAALGVVRGLAAAGLRVPEDCSVMGFDDVLPGVVATPSITTIRQPLKEMGLQAARWVLEAIEGWEHGVAPTPKLFLTQPSLVLRDSTAAVKS
jgi:LacI family transcriptional regulator